MLFDVKKYSTPDLDDVDLVKTKANVGVFLTAYLSARERVGQPREPKLTASYSLVPPSTANNSFEAENILIGKEEAMEEFLHLHKLFIKGYSAIQHPFKPDIAMRRKKIFMDRFVYGYPIFMVAERNHISEYLVSTESNEAIACFASALELIVFSTGWNIGDLLIF